MEQVILKHNGRVSITLDDASNTYTIRIRDCTGAVFTLNLNGDLFLGQNSVLKYSKETWDLLQSEIAEARLYLAKARLAGGMSLAKSNKTRYVSPNSIKPNSLCLDINGRYILYIGELDEKFFKDKVVINKEYWGILKIKGSIDSNYSNFINSNNGNEIYCKYNIYFNCYKSKPTKIVKVITEFPIDITKCYYNFRDGKFNNVLDYSFRKGV